MRKALTMDVEKKSVVPLPAPVSMLSMMMLTWMLLLMLALLSQYAIVSILCWKCQCCCQYCCWCFCWWCYRCWCLLVLSLTFKFHVRFTWMRWTTKEAGEWIAQPSPPIQLRANIYSHWSECFFVVKIFPCVNILMLHSAGGALMKCHFFESFN